MATKQSELGSSGLDSLVSDARKGLQTSNQRHLASCVSALCLHTMNLTRDMIDTAVKQW